MSKISADSITSRTSGGNISISNNVLIGSATSTGTESQTLQVTGGAYVSGTLGVGVTNPGPKFIVANGVKSSEDNSLFFLSSTDVTNPFQLLVRRSSNAVSAPHYSLQPVEQNVAYRNLVLNSLGGNVTIGSTLDTGTASQPLQVTGGAYVSGSVGVGTTNPQVPLDIIGNVRVVGVATITTVNDSKGDVRRVPQNSKTSSYTLISSDSGKHISITTGGVTVPSGVFSIGDAISIYNDSGSNQTITQGASTTLRLAGSASTGNRTLAQYGICTVLCVASNVFVVSGAGLS